MDDATRAQSADMLAAFRYTRDVYRTTSRLMQATEPAMSERGFRPYAAWAAVWPTLDPKLAGADWWLRSWVIRQYHRPPFQNREVLTIAAVLYDFDNANVDIPWLLASRMEITTPNGADPYWAGQIQRWSGHGPDGEVRRLSIEMPGVAHRVEKLRPLVGGGEVLSVAIPLVEATAIEIVERRLIEPLLAAPWEMR